MLQLILLHLRVCGLCKDIIKAAAFMSLKFQCVNRYICMRLYTLRASRQSAMCRGSIIHHMPALRVLNRFSDVSCVSFNRAQAEYGNVLYIASHDPALNNHPRR